MNWYHSEAALIIASIAMLVAAIEAGFLLGRRFSAKSDRGLAPHTSSMQTAMLGLLALLLGFSLSMSIARFDVRKQLVLEEANAISTTYLRADFLPEPERSETKSLLKNYVSTRIAYYDAGIDEQKITAALVHATTIESNLWSHATAAMGRTHNPNAVSLFTQSLNDVIDAHEKRQSALENHVPLPLIGLLFLVTIISMGFIGFNYGLEATRRHTSTAIVAGVFSLVLMVIIDIDRPRNGLIKVSQSSLERLHKELEQSPQNRTKAVSE